MSTSFLFLEPVFKEMIWGGSDLREKFGYDIPGDDTGECWAVSAHPNGDCTVVTREETPYSGKKLSELWKEEPALFGRTSPDDANIFPILTKIIDAKADLSIQVHPNDAYAKEHENGSLGKTECWYVLDAAEGATIVIGHHAKSREELAQMIEEKRWGELIREIPVHKGDFFFIEPGTVHAIKAGTLILETQQSSDITYRLYDYDRLQNGKPRQLHLQQSIDVITCPMNKGKIKKDDPVVYSNGNYIRSLVNCSLFSVALIQAGEPLKISQKDQPFTIVSVIEGAGKVGGYDVKKGDHFIIPAGYGDWTAEGGLSLITSWPNQID